MHFKMNLMMVKFTLEKLRKIVAFDILVLAWDNSEKGFAILPVSWTESIETPSLLSVWWSKEEWHMNSPVATLYISLFWRRVWRKKKEQG